MSVSDAIMDIECNDVSDERYIECFQLLIDDGIVWELQGFYGRIAMRLINAGLCTN